MEGYFVIKVTPLGPNLCLLEETEEGIIEELTGERDEWWKQWFLEVRRWREEDVDEGRTMWIRIYGVPAHAWNCDFFMSLANQLGSFICIDENTSNPHKP
ncbi:unnamed protein product [Vicia faba]|uniref:DUF4283 domain-containing protein n=1 Tax=Vicia faba TaxID=3906 RepID=A0AAV1A4B2_VICFA|nr:unnamed protein product [Vicia faba]